MLKISRIIFCVAFIFIVAKARQVWDGSQIHSGTGTPDIELGSEGDYYSNKDEYELYGPKTENGWDTPISLKGTANVLYSSWIDINWNHTDDPTYKAMNIVEERITDDFLDTGVIKVYLLSENNNSNGDVRIVYPIPNFINNAVLRYRVVNQTDNYDFKGFIFEYESTDGNNLSDLADIHSRRWAA
ncbi:MAG: hypothetical protein WEA58_07950 [Balneolaceae bacterium]